MLCQPRLHTGQGVAVDDGVEGVGEACEVEGKAVESAMIFEDF